MTEFWGHCSNLEVWNENDYDTRLLEKTLAFPLLKKLVRVRDKRAVKSFKLEVAERFEKGTDNVRQYLINEHLKEFSKEEFENLFRSVGNRYEDDNFWLKVEYKELHTTFQQISNRETIFLNCPTHKQIVNVYGNIGNNGLHLNCGCELYEQHDHMKYEISVVNALRK